MHSLLPIARDSLRISRRHQKWPAKDQFHEAKLRSCRSASPLLAGYPDVSSQRTWSRSCVSVQDGPRFASDSTICPQSRRYKHYREPCQLCRPPRVDRLPGRRSQFALIGSSPPSGRLDATSASFAPSSGRDDLRCSCTLQERKAQRIFGTLQRPRNCRISGRSMCLATLRNMLTTSGCSVRCERMRPQP
jgi:hypothetical protein